MISRSPSSLHVAGLVFSILFGFIARSSGESPGKGPGVGTQEGFRFHRILIADSESRASAMNPATGGARVVVMEVPVLVDQAFVNVIDPYIGQLITPESVGRLQRDVAAFVRKHGQELVDVLVPEQNVSRGDFRLAVVIGRYDLRRLLIAGSETGVADMQVSQDAGQIVLQDVPVLGTPEFGAAVAPSIGRPITNESIGVLISEISAYLRKHDELLAKAYIPTQDISHGELRLAVITGRYPLRAVLISDTPEKAARVRAQPGDGPVVARDAPLLATPEFATFIAPRIGEPITNESMERLRSDVVSYLNRHDRPVVNVTVTGEDLAAGEVRLAATIGRYKDLVFKGNRWFSSGLLQSRLGIKPGEEVRTSTLEAAINWTNQNPFRQVQVLLNTMNTAPGVADLDVAVQERIPFRFVASYDDTGNDVVGNNHYTGGLTFGNLWGLDQQLSYQFTTTDAGHLYRAQSAEYRIPLAWRDTIVISGALATFRPSVDNGLFKFNGKNVVLDAKYHKPLPIGDWSLDCSAGVDFKQTNNNLLYGGFYQIYANTIDVAQATGGLTAIRRDAHGSWVFSANANYSPGGFNSRNTEAAFNQPPNTGAQDRYVYGTFAAQRLTELPGGFELFDRGQLQLSSARLLGSEQLSIGGEATVRGYNERIFSGDQGWILNQELRGPSFQWKVPILPNNYRPLENRLLLFWDYGRVSYKHTTTVDFPLNPLMSTGFGLRSNLASNFSLTADYGWQILRTTYPQPRRDRGEIQVTFAY